MNLGPRRGLRRRAVAPAAFALLALLIGATAATAAARAEPVVARGAAGPRSVAVFDLELVDTSLQGEVYGTDPAELDRLRMIGDLLRERLAASTAYRVVDVAPAAEEIAAAGRLRTCNGCELGIAAGLGAELALIGWVQKVSNLILNINLAVRDVASGRLVMGASVDIRGNTDESWSRGMRYLLEHHLLAVE